MPVRLEPITGFSHVEIDRDAMLDPQGEQLRQVNDAWLALCEKNPRYFNGSMLAYRGHDPQTGVITAALEQYKHHAVRQEINLGVSVLSVTAIVTAGDRVLLGKRSPHSHFYGGLWELGPSGVVDAPEMADVLSEPQIVAEALREVREEAGFATAPSEHAILALVHDDLAGSVDIAITLRFGRTPQIQANWEYSETKWVTPGELDAMCQDAPDELIPTTVALGRFLHQGHP